MAAKRDLLYVGIKGFVVALDRPTGDVVWSTELPKGSQLVPIVRDADALYAISGGEVTCLDAATGTIRWHNPLTGYGRGFASFAMGDAVTPAFASIAAQRAAAASTSHGAGGAS